MDKKETVLDSNNREESYYEILECSETASPIELKRNYQRLIKKYHPDKQEGSTSNERFILIDKAYKTLVDTNLRKEYDSSLLREVFDEQFLIYTEVLVSELEFNEDNVAYYPCRCGDNFVIEKAELIGDKYVTECFQCSNNILIKS